MSTSLSLALQIDSPDIDTETYGCTCLVTSATLASQTDVTSPSISHRAFRRSSDVVMLDKDRTSHTSDTSGEWIGECLKPSIHGGISTQNDVVGQYLAWRDAQRASVEALQAPITHYVSANERHSFQGHQSVSTYDSCPYGRWFPDPDSIRHLHALHSLLPHISPERRLNALSGLELDIIDGNTGHVFCRGVPKKLLVLLLGREVVSKFIRTFQRSDNAAWRGPPTEQKLVLPPKATSAAAIKILVSWMERACRFATMSSMKPLRIPNNLFVACSLARTLELFKLHRDAYRLDVAIMQQFLSRRPIFAAEIETMWTCMGENDRYVYACIRALGQRMSDPRVADDVEGLAERYPELYARLCDPGSNELYRPIFGRKWFGELSDQRSQRFQTVRLGSAVADAAFQVASHPLRYPRGPQTGDMRMQSAKSMDPTAPAFVPTSKAR